MSVKTTLTALALIVVAGTAGAASNNPGEAQLSRQLGVEPGTLTLSQLSQLSGAKSTGDQDTVKFILSGISTRAPSAAGNAQLEAQLRVEPGRFTATELVALSTARRENDTNAANFILSGANRATPASAEVVTPGKAQLAAIVGVNPADYTLAQLTVMQPTGRN